jgi:hypothetical protein
MPIYKEKKEKLTLEIISNERPVNIRVACYYGTTSEISYYLNDLKEVPIGEEVKLGTGSELKGKRLLFTSAASNKDGLEIKLDFTLTQEGTEPLTYTFPEDYTGTPDFNTEDQEPTHQFHVKFV